MVVGLEVGLVFDFSGVVAWELRGTPGFAVMGSVGQRWRVLRRVWGFGNYFRAA